MTTRTPTRPPPAGQRRGGPDPVRRPSARTGGAGGTSGATRVRRGPRTGRTPVRLRLTLLVVCVVASLYAGKLFQVQALESSALAQEALQQRLRTAPLLAHRGDVLDREGQVLASHRRAAPHHRRPDAGGHLRRPRRPAAGRPPGRRGEAGPGPRRRRRDAHRGPGRRQAVRLPRQGHPARGLARGRPPCGSSASSASRPAAGPTPPAPWRAAWSGFVGEEGHGLAGLEMSLDDQLSGDDGLPAATR